MAYYAENSESKSCISPGSYQLPGQLFTQQGRGRIRDRGAFSPHVRSRHFRADLSDGTNVKLLTYTADQKDQDMQRNNQQEPDHHAAVHIGQLDIRLTPELNIGAKFYHGRTSNKKYQIPNIMTEPPTIIRASVTP